MTLPTYTVPSPNTDTAEAEPLVITALAELKSLLNGDLTAENFSPGSQLPLDHLESGTDAQIIVCTNTGAPAYRAMSGHATIDNLGEVTITDAPPTILDPGATAGDLLLTDETAAAAWVPMSGGATIDGDGVVTLNPEGIDINDLGGEQTCFWATATDEPIATGVQEEILWDAFTYVDNDDMNSGGSSINLSKSGVWGVSATGTWEADQDGYRQMAMVGTSGTFAPGLYNMIGGAAATSILMGSSVIRQTLSGIFFGSFGTQVRLYVEQNSGNSLTFSSGQIMLFYLGKLPSWPYP